jgi:hypothetical protein
MFSIGVYFLSFLFINVTNKENMYKLVAKEGYHWKKAGYIFSNIVWVHGPDDAKLYKLLDEDYEPVRGIDISSCLVKEDWDFEKKEEESQLT